MVSFAAFCMDILDQWNTLHSMGEHLLALDQTGDWVHVLVITVVPISGMRTHS